MKLTSIKFILFAIISISLFSCKKDINNESGGVTTVTLSINGTDALQNNTTKVASNNKLISNVTEQKLISKLNDQLALVATLTPISATEQATSIFEKTSTTITKELQENTKVKILVYDSKGAKFKEIDHTYKTNDATEIDIDNLNIGEAYTFIAYSTNSTSTIPEPQNKTNLSTLIINDLTTEFLYFKENKIVISGPNTVNIKLKHQYSEVTTSLEIDQTGDFAGSVVTQMTAPTLSPAYSKASYNLATGSSIFQQSALITNGKTLTIDPTNGLKNPIVTNPTLIMADGTNSTLVINSITINGSTHTVNLNGFNIMPGVKYKLKLQASCPCLTEATPTEDILMDFQSGTDIRTKTYIYSSADYGAVLDIYKIDNSFNLKINETHIYQGTAYTDATKSSPITTFPANEIQFQGYNQYPSTNSPPNIEFEDGSRWGKDVNETSEIWNFDGSLTTPKKPIIKLTISADGEIKMFGSKSTTGGEPFYPIKLINNQTVNNKYITGAYNTIDWKKNGQANTIVLSQNIEGATGFSGFITGKKIIPCSQATNTTR